MENEEKYFAAANSGGGFWGLYDSVFGGTTRRYIIKGGPGTGKSRFMREAGVRAEASGCKTVYFYCSSDPQSLDGVLIDGEIAILDGTAPHAVEASCPGARDELIDLGAFWDSDALRAEREAIIALGEKKAAAFRRAYECLAAAEHFTRAADEITAPCLRPGKLKAAAARALRDLPDGVGGERHIVTDSFGMRGRVRLETLEQLATTHCAVRDFGGCGHIFLSEIVAQARRRGIPSVISHTPLIPERPDAVFLPRDGMLFSLHLTDGDRVINMRRFAPSEGTKPYRAELKRLNACRTSAIESALSALAAAAQSHFELEAIYIGAMDFPAKEKFTRDFLSAVFD